MKKTTLGIMLGIGLICICLIVGIVLFNPFFKENLQAGSNTEEEVDDSQWMDTEDDNLLNTEEIISTEDTETEETETKEVETEITESESEIPESETEIKEEENNNIMTQTPTPAPVPVTPSQPYYIKINRTSNVVTIYIKDVNGNYTIPVKAMVCSVGIGEETPTGIYHTKAKYEWRELFGGAYGYYTTRIVDHILFHSVPYEFKRNDSLLAEEYNKLGQKASAGCVRLSVEDAKWIYDNCPIGVTVEIFDSNEPDPLGKPTALKLDTNNPYARWDPTDPASNNPWKTVKPVITGVKNVTFERCGKTDYSSYVTVKDSWGNSLEVKTTGTVDGKTCGSYTVTYSTVDPIGNTATATAKITITDKTAPVISQIQNIVLTDSSTDIEKIVRDYLVLTDNGEALDKSLLTLNLNPITEAMSQKAYGTISCEAAATDKYGNKSSVFNVSIVYEKEDMEAPVITVLMTGTSNVDLTGITDEAERQTSILNAAIHSVQKDIHYSVSDDVSAVEEIVCTITGNYSAATTAGEHEVILTITATDKSGKISSQNITVNVMVVDTTEDVSTETIADIMQTEEAVQTE